MSTLNRKTLLLEKTPNESKESRLVENLSGSVKVFNKLEVKDIDKVIEASKKQYFSKFSNYRH